MAYHGWLVCMCSRSGWGLLPCVCARAVLCAGVVIVIRLRFCSFILQVRA